MVSGPNNLPEVKFSAAPAAPAPAKRLPADPQLQLDHKLVLAPDTVHISPAAQSAVHTQAVTQTAAQAAPEVRPERVQDATIKISAHTQNSSAVNAQLAEKLLTES